MNFKEKIKKILKDPYFNWGILVAALIVAIIFSVISGNLIPEILKMRGAGHVVEFAILSLLLFRALYVSGVKKNTAVYAAVIAIGIGLLIEFYQKGSSNRTFQYGDILANTLGAILVQCLGKIKSLFLD